MSYKKIIQTGIVILVIIIIIILIVLIIISKNTNSSFNADETVEQNVVDINQINEQIQKNLENEKNEFNQFQYANIDDKEMAIYYFNMIIEDMLYEKERGYALLEPEYKQKRFSDINKYIDYTNKQDSILKNAVLSKYRKKEMDNYTQYVLIDQNNNYYIINETSVMQYKIILDEYTLDLPEYIEKYDKATQKEKIQMCIERFIRAIKDENYTFAYNFLSEGFKSNYFKTENNFKEYSQMMLENKTKIEYLQYEDKGGIYTYKVNLLNNAKENITTKTFIIKLKEGTEFELSFDV